MALLKNLGLFFVVFLPLTLLVGLPGDYYLARHQSPEEATPIFYWMLVGWRVLLPCILFLPLAHLALAVSRRAGWRPDQATLRRVSLVVLPLGMLAMPLWLLGVHYLSVPLVVSVVVPGVVLGWLARIPLPRRAA